MWFSNGDIVPEAKRVVGARRQVGAVYAKIPLMLARIFSCAVIGLEGVVIEVEVDYTNGLPGMTIVGLPDAAVQESRERVQTAVKNAGLHFPRHRIVVNLAPAIVRKEGPAYDLPIALGVIILADYLPHDVVDNTLVIGELSLDGAVRHTRGILPMAALHGVILMLTFPKRLRLQTTNPGDKPGLVH